MDEIKEESCSTASKKCCTKGIMILVVCSLVCFFLGYYFGNKSNSNINRAVGYGINRPFSPNRIPNVNRMPTPGISKPTIPRRNIQRPPIQKPSIQRTSQNIPTLKPVQEAQVSKVQSTQLKQPITKKTTKKK